MMIYKENDKVFKFTRRAVGGVAITTVPQGLWFTVKDKNGKVLISKSLNDGITADSDGNWLISISALDTVEIPAGSYNCDVKVKDEIGREFTIVKPQKFDIADAVTLRENQR